MAAHPYCLVLCANIYKWRAGDNKTAAYSAATSRQQTNCSPLVAAGHKQQAHSSNKAHRSPVKKKQKKKKHTTVHKGTGRFADGMRSNAAVTTTLKFDRCPGFKKAKPPRQPISSSHDQPEHTTQGRRRERHLAQILRKRRGLTLTFKKNNIHAINVTIYGRSRNRVV